MQLSYSQNPLLAESTSEKPSRESGLNSWLEASHLSDRVSAGLGGRSGVSGLSGISNIEASLLEILALSSSEAGPPVCLAGVSGRSIVGGKLAYGSSLAGNPGVGDGIFSVFADGTLVIAECAAG